MDRIISRLRDGDVLRMEISSGLTLWWFEGPYEIVPDEAARRILHLLQERGDSLFGLSGASQSWVLA
jgi:hypothetical protein